MEKTLLVEKSIEDKNCNNIDSHKSFREKDDVYFRYYGMLNHQQNMLMDDVRTRAYQEAITLNRSDFEGKVVLDVGAGTGILSFFAAQAGARLVYAVEASGMAAHAETLVKANGMDHLIQVIRGKIEEVVLPEPIDVIISEPMGVLLLHERMMESFLIARDRFLISPNDNKAKESIKSKQMWPSSSLMYFAPFSDVALYADSVSKVQFWNNHDFYGVDFTSLIDVAVAGQFGQTVVGPIDPRTLLAPPEIHEIDFCSAAVSDLQEVSIEFTFIVDITGVLHGIAGWFDVVFGGSTSTRILSTSPFTESTHWYQARFLFRHPIAVNRGQRLTGTIQMKANEQRSSNVIISMDLEGAPQSVNQKATFLLHEQIYWNLNGASTLAHGSNVTSEQMALYPGDLF